MNPISDSPIKESIRLRYHNSAMNQEQLLRNQLSNNITSMQSESNAQVSSVRDKIVDDEWVTWVSIGCGIFSAIIFFNLFVGIVIGIVICAVGYGIINNINSAIDEQKKSIINNYNSRIEQHKRDIEAKIREAYVDADRRTRHDIDEYEKEVKLNFQKMIKKPEVFKSMVDHSVSMFQRVVSHADNASNRKFVETDFTFVVTKTGISYKYQSTYSNPRDDFNFDIQRYRNLNTDAECEGLAQAIAKMTINKMKGLYPPSSLNITVSHVDAAVTLHFKAANKNYVPPRDIY